MAGLHGEGGAQIPQLGQLRDKGQGRKPKGLDQAQSTAGTAR
jgi:hypothetical protein